MKFTTSVAKLLIATLCLTSCGKLFFDKCDVGLGSTHVIGLNETMCSSSDKFSVTFTNVIYDERCFGSGCTINDGVAKLRFQFKYNGQSTPFHLYTSNTSGYYADTTINGFQILLGVVTPEPRAGQSFSEKDYKLELTVRK